MSVLESSGLSKVTHIYLRSYSQASHPMRQSLESSPAFYWKVFIIFKSDSRSLKDHSLGCVTHQPWAGRRCWGSSENRKGVPKVGGWVS